MVYCMRLGVRTTEDGGRLDRARILSDPTEEMR